MGRPFVLRLLLARRVRSEDRVFVESGDLLYGQLICNSLIWHPPAFTSKSLRLFVVSSALVLKEELANSALALGSYLDSLDFDRPHSLAFGSLGAACSRRSISGRDVVDDSSEDSQELSCSPILPGMIAMGHAAEQTYSNLSFAFEKLREAGICSVDTRNNGIVQSSIDINELTIDDEKLIYIVETRKRRINSPDLTAFAVRVHKNGRLGRKRAISFGEVETLAAQSDLPLDYAIGSLKKGIEQWELNRAYSYHEYPDDYHDVFKLLMTRILKTGRCFLGCRDGPLLHLGRELPGRFQWKEVYRNTYKLALVAVDGKRTIPVMPWCCPWYRDAYTGRFGPVDIPGAEFLHSRVLELNPLDGRDATAFAVRLARSGLSKYISLPPSPSPKIELKLVDRKPVLNTSYLPALPGGSEGKSSDDNSCSVLRLSYPSMALTDRVYYDKKGRKIVEVQDRAYLDTQLQMIRDLGFVDITDKVEGADEDEHFFCASSPDSWDELNEHALACLSDGGIDIEEGFLNTVKPVVLDEGDITFEVDESSGLSWWFSLVAFINVGDRKIPLMPVVKSALDKLPVISQQSVDALNRDGRFYASLEDGTRISMPFARIKAILEALQELLSDHGMGMSAVQAANLFLDEGLDRAVWLNADKLKQTALILKELCELEGKAPPVVPDIFKGKLRPYQLIGLQWLQILSAAGMGGILADDMGLGKTIQLIAHICKEKVAGRLEGEPFLVICPTSVVPNWLSEVRNFASIFLFMFTAALSVLKGL
ncbi:MAG: SNF2-related protein [Cyanobacteriota/Melainabacteria group bacterium]